MKRRRGSRGVLAMTLALAAWCILVDAFFAHAAPLPAEGGPPGRLPVGADGKPLNPDFETGTLDDWVASGEAFAGQPVQGDLPTKRGRDMTSDHTGNYWVGGYEVSHSDEPQGTLTSAPFKVTPTFASFLIAGGSVRRHARRAGAPRQQRVIFSRSGDNTETLKPVVVDLFAAHGPGNLHPRWSTNSGGWGHVNFDDFRLHAARPVFPNAPAQSRARRVSLCRAVAGRRGQEHGRARGLPRDAWRPASPT